MNGAIWVLLIVLVLFATTLLLHRFIDGKLPFLRLPVTWFYGSWILGLFLLTMPLFKYFEAFNELSAAYLVAVLLSFSTGSVAAAFWNHRRNRKPLPAGSPDNVAAFGAVNVSSRWIYSLLTMGLIGTALLMLNTLLGGSLSLTDRFDSDNFGAVRAAHMMAAESRIGPLFGPATLMSSIGGLGVAFVFYLRGSRLAAIENFRLMFRLAILVLLINVVIGIVGFGSRMFAVFAVVIAFVAFLEGRWSIGETILVKKPSLKGFLVILCAALVTLVVLWSAATVFLEKRVQQQSPQSLLFRTHRASFDPVLYSLTRNDKAAQYFFFSLSYFTTPIPTLAFYLDLPESHQPGPFFGQYNFPAIARWTRRLTFSGDPYAWDKARFEVFRPLGDIGFGMNVWSTLIRDLIADFGKLGTLLFLAFVGFASQRVFDKQSATPNARMAGLLVYLRLVLVFAGLVSVLFMPQIHWPLYLAIILVSIRSGASRGKTTFSPIDRRRVYSRN